MICHHCGGIAGIGALPIKHLQPAGKIINHDDMKIKQGWFQQNGDAQHSILYLQLETNHLPSVLLQGKALAKQSRLQEFKISGVWPPFPVSDGRFGSSIQSPIPRGNKHVAIFTTHSTAVWSGIPSLLI